MSALEDGIELFYFGAPNRAVLARLSLYAGGIPFKDTVLDPQSHAEFIAQGKSIFGSLPVLQHGNERLAQSQAVAAYAAEISGLIALTPLARAKDAMLTNTLEDVSSGNIRIQGGDGEGKSEKIRELIDKYFKAVEAILPESGSFVHGGEHPTLGDLAIFAMASYSHPKYGPQTGWSQYVPDWSTHYPKICAIRDRVRGLPQLSAYFDRWGRFHMSA